MIFTRDGTTLRAVEIQGRRWDVILMGHLALIAVAGEGDSPSPEEHVAAYRWFIENQEEFDLWGYS